MLAWLPSWFTAFALPFLLGLAQQLWAEWQRNKAMVDAGATQQRAADRRANDAISDDARATKAAVDQATDGELDAELARLGWASGSGAP